jgi:hypothetical protein
MNYEKEIDFSSLDTLMLCQRKFLFSNIMGIQPEHPNIDLAFGSAMHSAYERGYRAIKDAVTFGVEVSPLYIYKSSVEAFDKNWEDNDCKVKFPDEDDIYPKSPMRAYNILDEYWKRKVPLFTPDKRKIICVEEPFAAIIKLYHDVEYLYRGKMDLVFKDLTTGNLVVLDHKTAKSVNKASHIVQSSSYQADGYCYEAKLFSEDNKIPEINIEFTLVQKGKIDFITYVVLKSERSTNMFLFELTNILRKLKADYINLIAGVKADVYQDQSKFIPYFPRNPGSACAQYYRQCPYFELCNMRNNPLTYLDNIPPGFKQSFWSPEGEGTGYNAYA